MSKIKVPDGMSRAAIRAASQAWDAGDLKIVYPPYPNEPFYNHSTVILEAALLWLSENPIAPTDKQFFDLSSDVGDVRMRCVEWQRRMFLAPEPETSFDSNMNALTVEVNRLGISAAIEILRRTS